MPRSRRCWWISPFLPAVVVLVLVGRNLQSAWHHATTTTTATVTNLPDVHLLIVNASRTTLKSSTSPKKSPMELRAASVSRTNKVTPPRDDSGNTKIVAFADMTFREIAVQWYHRLSELGYTTHTIVAFDQELYHNLTRDGGNSLRVEHVGGPDCLLRTAFNNRIQAYRRRLFATRWVYVLRQLQNHTHVLLTDADNGFHQYVPMSRLESSSYDVYHAMEGSVPSFPKNVYAAWGFTVCGGMTWLRSTPKVINFLQTLTEQRCRCPTQTCSCRCDDQVVWNNVHLEHGLQWDYPKHLLSAKATSTNQLSHDMVSQLRDWLWNHTLTGVCNTTGLRIQLWDRTRAYRGPIPFHNASQCPSIQRNWVTMPHTPPGSTKRDLQQLWISTCRPKD